MQSTLAHCCDARVAAEGRCVGEVLGMGKRQAAVPVSGRARMYSEPRKRGGWGEGGWGVGAAEGVTMTGELETAGKCPGQRRRSRSISTALWQTPEKGIFAKPRKQETRTVVTCQVELAGS